ncbi:MAG: hypothetical protein ABI823_10635 [Bryobacteraceae bacterium]
MNAQFNYSAAAALLASGRILANGAQAGAVIAAAGCLLAPHSIGRIAFSVALVFWVIGIWFAVRVEIDVHLFRAMASDPEESGEQLDTFLERFLARKRPPRSQAERIQGSMQLWRSQIGLFFAEAGAFAAGILCVLAGW